MFFQGNVFQLIFLAKPIKCPDVLKCTTLTFVCLPALCIYII